MDKKQISQGTHASVLSHVNRQPLGARVLLVLLFLALSLASLQPRASAQGAAQSMQSSSSATRARQGAIAPNCVACQDALTACVQNGGSNCSAEYSACMATCQ
jgi:hypothetical protein